MDKWLDPAFCEAHRAAQERRRRMPGVAHHEGNHSLSRYAQAWVRGYVSIHSIMPHLKPCCYLSRSRRHTGDSLAPCSPRMACPTRAWRRPMSPSMWMTRPRRTPTRAYTTRSPPTRRWQGRSMARTMIHPPTTLMETLS